MWPALAVALSLHAPVEVVERGERCPAMRVGDRVVQYLEGSSLQVDAPLRAQTVLERTPEGWHLQLTVSDRSPRSFRAARCETVVDAAAFTIAVAIDPNVIDTPTLAIPPPPPKPEPEPEPEPEPDPKRPRPRPRPREPPAPPDPPPARSVAVAIALGVAAGAMGGSLPAAGFIARPWVGIVLRRFRADVTALYRTPSRATADADPESGGRISLWNVGLRGCGLLRPATAPLEIPFCAGVEAGQVLGAGFGFEGADSTRLPWLGLSAGPGLAWVIRPSLALVVHAEVGAAPLGGTFVIEALETVHTVGPVFGRGWVGIEGRIGRRSPR